MEKISDVELKNIQIEILDTILKFCEKNQIRWWVVGGTAIGAVRHHGFIPWDDDVDIAMPRDDYERFAKTFNGFSDRYIFCDYREQNGWYLKFGKVFDTQTKTVETLYRDLPQTGVYVDVFPLDGLSNDINIAKKIARTAKKQCVIAERLFMSIDYTGPVWKKVGKSIYRFIFSKFIRLERHTAKFVEYATHYSYDASDYVGNISDGMYGERQVLDKKWLGKGTYLPFENIMVPVPEDYDNYLSHLYGDYMKLPPQDKQKPHHTFIAYWKDGVTTNNH